MIQMAKAQHQCLRPKVALSLPTRLTQARSRRQILAQARHQPRRAHLSSAVGEQRVVAAAQLEHQRRAREGRHAAAVRQRGEERSH